MESEELLRTEREQAEEALRKCEMPYRYLFDDSPIPLWEEDVSAIKVYLDELKRDGVEDLPAYLEQHPEVVSHCVSLIRIIDINRAALDMYGATDKEALMGEISEAFYTEAFLDTIKNQLFAIAQGTPRFKRELTTQISPGTMKHISLSGSVAPDYEATYGKVLVSLVDITERKQAEEELERFAFENEYAKVTLEEQAHQLAEIIYELEAAKEQAEAATRQWQEANQKLKENQAHMVHSEKLASLGQLAAGVAHEINNPIGFVTSNLGTLSEYTEIFTRLLDAHQTLIDQLAPDQRATHQGVLRRIDDLREEEDLDFLREDVGDLLAESLNGLHRVKEIVQGLKSFARLDEADMQVTDVNECIEATLTVISNEIKYRCEVHKKLCALPQIRCYPGQLNQVFMNLLMNAVHAIEEHGEITIETQALEGEVIIRISDTGKGIPAEIIPKLFNPFFTTKPVGQGTGLGLSISYGIIQKHGGRIEVESEVGRGTTFTIYLPITEGHYE